MQRFVYPAIFYKDDDMYRVIFPDIELVTDGKIIEEAFLYAKAFLKEYFMHVAKYELDYNLPSDFETVKKGCKNDDYVMLIDATLPDRAVK